MDRQVVDELFRAMQLGPAGEERMMALFRDDAVLTEPFSGEPRTHRGLDEIRRSFRESNEQGPSDWFTIRGGKIAELEITVTEMPQ